MQCCVTTAVVTHSQYINTLCIASKLLGAKKMMREEEFEEEDAEFWYDYCQENPDDPDCYELYEDFE